MKCSECDEAATIHVWDVARGELHFCEEHGGPHWGLGPIPFADRTVVLTREDIEQGRVRLRLTTGETASPRLPQCAREGDVLLNEWRIEESSGDLESIDFVDERFVLTAADIGRGCFYSSLADGSRVGIAVPETMKEGDVVLIPRPPE
ncbi:MAG: hypothetical protein ACYTKD_08160 [Planctomycetota bacterium]|jgi:hypothetical protein